MHLQGLGDTAVLATAADEESALQFAAAVRAARPTWLLDVVPAYRSVGVFFDADAVGVAVVLAWLDGLPGLEDSRRVFEPGASNAALRIISIPCCYDLGPDLAHVAAQTGLSPDEVVTLHTSQPYTVYAIGFCPGFPYLGYLPEPLVGVPRLASPRLRVEPGSVGLTGRQTGVYTLPRPGGWPVIGRTPLTLVDLADGYFPLRAGDRVQFVAIDRDEYERRLGERLPAAAR